MVSHLENKTSSKEFKKGKEDDESMKLELI